MLRHLLVSFAVLAAVGCALALADNAEEEAGLDMEIIMSDMPLTNLHKMNFADGEHQANDMGPVLILLVETCNGTPI